MEPTPSSVSNVRGKMDVQSLQSLNTGEVPPNERLIPTLVSFDHCKKFVTS